MTDDRDTPMEVPISEAKIVCEPVFAVTSARFSWIANDLCTAALEAAVVRYDIFLPTFAIDAINKKYCGAKGVRSSIKQEASNTNAARNRQRLGSASNLLCT